MTGAGQRGHLAAQGVGELDGGRADAARRAADEDFLPGREAYGVPHRDQRRRTGDDQGGRFGRGECRRGGREPVRGDDDVLGRPADGVSPPGVNRAPHPVPDPQTETRHLHSLAAAARTPARRPRHHAPEEVSPTTLRLLRTMTSPSVVVGRFLDVLAWNPLAGALLGEFTQRPRSERNLLSLLLHPEADRTCPERAATVAELVAMLRTQVAAEPGHPRAVELVGELAVRSDEFAGLWARHDVAETTRGRMRVRHPLVGELNLDRDAYPMPDATGPVLIAFTAEEGGPDAERLQLLAGLLVAPRPGGSVPSPSLTHRPLSVARAILKK
ncbi:hypothetical protein ACFTY8_31350 [Streptomyces mirabilis]|uniref:MmyB family transcriptional regulator n=1 Tax=Streptomyces mirabilis TaxID=68239 RepID=UPI00362CF605